MRLTEKLWIGLIVAGFGAISIASFGFGQPAPHQPEPAPASTRQSPQQTPQQVAGVPLPTPLKQTPQAPQATNDRASETLAWRLNNPAPNVIPDSRANPAAVADKFASRARSIEQRAAIRAFEGAPPVIPHATTNLNIQTCRACHAQGLKAGDKVARMVSHTYLTNCTQCHVDASVPLPDDDRGPANTFAGLRPSGYGGTRAYTGAPPVIPHTTFMRVNCVSCHGEFGYDGWRPDHLSRTNCIQCHAPEAELDQLAPTFGTPDLPDGRAPAAIR